ncbi:MAG: bi-domain-containing oxidoreductase [Anaerolineae bacterium]|jgi:predicted dehydrogenase/threonine dehydrogenase-like Zn-dependent dehydrogenase|nr:bi-domain-containing oxidoreductase [Anaerolineae bacterium]
MKQLLQNMKDGKAVVVEMPVPGIKTGFALVKTAASLVSAGTERMVVEFAEKSLIGKAQSRPDLVKQVLDKAKREGVLTTMEAAFNRLEQPMALGYSSAGTIVELGQGMDGFHIGQRVACAGGGYAVHAEYALVPKNLITPLPDNVDFQTAAFTTLGAIAMQGFRLAEAHLGESVAVIGLGLLGLLTIQICKAAGCRVFGVDLDPRRVELAGEYGVEAVLRDDAEAAAGSFTNGIGFDHVLICADTTSNDPVWLAGQIARDSATVVAVGAVGMNIPRRVYYQKELNFIVSRSYGPGRYDTDYEEGGQDYPPAYVRWTEGRNMASVVQLMADGQLEVEKMITHRYPIEDAVKAYALITGKLDEAFLGVVLEYSQDEERQFSRKVELTRIQKNVVKSGYRLGVLGAGNYAKAVFLPTVRKSRTVRLDTIVSASGMSAASAGRQFGFKHASSVEADVLQSDEIDVVAILSRHHLHADQVVQCLSQRKHVYCEKPLAITNEGLLKVVNVMKATPTSRVTVGYNRRFAPMAKNMKTFFNEHEPMHVHYRVNAGPLPDQHWLHNPEQGGGRIIGEGCHFIDFICFMVGDVPVSVQVTALPGNETHQNDNVTMVFTFANGSVGVVDYLSNGPKTFPKEMVEVFQRGKAARLDDFRTLSLATESKRKTSQAYLRQDKGHKAAWKTFIESISANQGSIPARQLIGVTQASFAVVESLHRGEKVVIPDLWVEG